MSVTTAGVAIAGEASFMAEAPGMMDPQSVCRARWQKPVRVATADVAIAGEASVTAEASGTLARRSVRRIGSNA